MLAVYESESKPFTIRFSLGFILEKTIMINGSSALRIRSYTVLYDCLLENEPE
jgi:hypothetical protein